MTLESNEIADIYAGNVAKKYDRFMSHFFARFKRMAFDDSSLKRGDNVIVFCCGTGLDFPPILKKIGTEGSIVGVDFSSEMLGRAQEKIATKQWKNIELIEADVTSFKDTHDTAYDVGVCTLGMSIIPDYLSAYHNLKSHVTDGGEIIIGDMQLASGWHARLNPLIIFLAQRFGGTHEGHHNCVELQALMKRELSDVRMRELFFHSYFYCTGKVLSESTRP
jgi:ubiquinone/menaquinone biosynthesis C-methylase UbiE